MADRTPGLVVKRVQMITARQVEHGQATARLQMPMDLAQGGALITEVRERIKAEQKIELSQRLTFQTNIEENKLRPNLPLAGLHQHRG